MSPRKLLCVFLLIAALPACAPLKLYRSDYSPCVIANSGSNCDKHALQEYKSTLSEKGQYGLGFIELDDQGQLFDRAQMDAVITDIYRQAGQDDQDIINVVFVHGWKHSAAPGDSNIETFRTALMHLSEKENAISEMTGVRPRKIVGTYLGWRGASLTAPVLKELTFWDRKNTAHKVGHGGVTEVLERLDLIRQEKDSLAPSGHSRSRLIVVGHSFGGAVVYSALAQILEARFIRTVGPIGTASDAEGFGNLVVLINPAFEAELFSSLSDMSTERGAYFKSQLPVLAVLTSEADDATKVAFPIGRWFSTLFEKDRKVMRKNSVTKTMETIDQGKANVTAVGHFEPYRTHYLSAEGSDKDIDAFLASPRLAARSVLQASQSWEDDAPGSKIKFPGTALSRTTTSAGRNPYLIVRVDKQLIHDHNDIANPRVAEFLSHLILVSSQSRDTTERSSQRRTGLSK